MTLEGLPRTSSTGTFGRGHPVNSQIRLSAASHRDAAAGCPKSLFGNLRRGGRASSHSRHLAIFLRETGFSSEKISAAGGVHAAVRDFTGGSVLCKCRQFSAAAGDFRVAHGGQYVSADGAKIELQFSYFLRPVGLERDRPTEFFDIDVQGAGQCGGN